MISTSYTTPEGSGALDLLSGIGLARVATIPMVRTAACGSLIPWTTGRSPSPTV